MTNNTIPNAPRELLERCAQYTPTLEKQEDRARALSELRAMLSAPSPAGVDDDYVPEGLAQAIMQSEEVDAVALAAKSLKDAGVDGLEVVGYKFTRTFNGETFLSKDGGMFAHHTSEPLCRLSDAQAIIDGLRGEVASLENRRLDANAQVGNTRFGVGIKERTVIDAAKRYAEYMAQPEQEADRIAKGAEFLAALQAPAQAIALRAERDQQAQRIAELEGLLRVIGDWIVISSREYRHNATYVMLHRIDAALSAGKEGE